MFSKFVKRFVLSDALFYSTLGVMVFTVTFSWFIALTSA